MAQYIDKDALVAEIEKRINFNKTLNSHSRLDECKAILSFINSIEVKEVEENKLPNPRFPHLNNIVDKVFGTGNLESLEYEEAEQLVLLAKEELLKDLEVKEVDFEEYYHKFLEKEWFGNLHVRTVSEMMAFTAKHFFELGIKAQKGEEYDCK